MPADFPPKSSLTFTTPSGPITASGDIALEFSGAIHAGSGKITITDGITQSFTARDGSIQTRIVGASDTRVIDIGSSEVTIDGNTLTINPSANLKLGLDYHVVIDSGAVLDAGNQPFAGLTHTGVYHFTPLVPIDLTISFESDNGSSSSDLITNEGWQTIYIDLSEQAAATDRVEVLIDGTWVTANRMEDEGPDYFWVDADLHGSGTISARLVSGNDVVKALQSNAFVIDQTAPGWDPDNAALYLNIGSDTGDTGDDTTQYTTVVIDVDLHNMSGLQAGDIISLRELYYDGYEGYELGEQRGLSHTVTAADLAGNGQLSFQIMFDPDRDFGEGYDAHFPLTVAVSDVAGNLRHSNDTLDLYIDRSSAYFEGMETSNDLTKLYLHFSEVVRPAGFKLINLDDDSEITITPGMMAEVPESSTLEITLPAALADGAQYRLESIAFLYDTAGNITTTHPLVEETTVRFGLDAVLHTIAISNDSGAADGVTNVAAQTFSGSFDGALYTGQFIEVSLDGGDTWTVAHVSGTTWSLDGTLTSGDHLVVARVHTPYGYGEEIHTNVAYQTTAPALSSTPVLDADDDHGIDDGITNATTITVSPMISSSSGLHAGDRIELIDSSNTVLGYYTLTSADFGTYGSVNHDIDITLGTGEHQIRARVLDGAGNVGTAGGTLTVTIDNTAPGLGSAPVLLSAYDNGASNSDGITTLKDVTVRALLATESGYREGDVVQIINSNGDVLGAHTIISSDFDYGSITDLDISLSTLSEGSHTLSVRVNDVAGNVATGPSMTMTVIADTEPPSAVLDVGSLDYDSVTGLMSIGLSGDATDTKVEYSQNGGATWIAATLNASKWEFTTNTGIQPGVTFRVVDGAGNVGSGVGGMPAGTIVHIESDWNQTMGADGYDVLYTNGGDDYIIYSSPDGFKFVDAGGGSDTLAFTGAFSFSAADLAGKIFGVENLELNGAITMSVADEYTLMALGTPTLKINGSAAAMVDLSSGAWTHQTTIGGYEIYSAGNTTLEIAEIVGVDLGTA